MKEMGIHARVCALCFLLPAVAAMADTMRGTVSDSAGSPVAGARVSALDRMGVFADTATDTAGDFELNVPDVNTFHLVVTAPGFETKIVNSTDSTRIQLALAPISDPIKIPGSAVDAAGSQLGTNVTVITGEEIRERNEAQALDLLRYVPGIYVAQGGQRGGAGSVSIRGGDARDNLVLIDGVPVNSFANGGYFDFSRIPSAFLSQIEVARGPQSAIYGSYATGGVVDFETRSPGDGTRIDVLAEGGSNGERRFGLSGSGTVEGIGIAASLSRTDSDGPVRNSAYRNENVFLNLTKRWAKQSISGFGNYDANKAGEPGPYGLDAFSNSRNYFSDYGLHYLADFTASLRQEVFGSFFLNNTTYNATYKDIRGQAEERTTWNILKQWTMAAGFVFAREEAKNTYFLRRDDEGIYWDNQIRIGQHLYIDAGVREELFQQVGFSNRTYSRLNPKISGAYISGTARLHGSFGTGIRPPGAMELALADNPNLRPERGIAGDIGVEIKLLANKLSLDGTYFYNKYKDLIVVPGGNIGRARSSGEELSARFHPARWFTVGGSYTHLNTAVLAPAPQYYAVGQELPQRPANSGELTSSFTYSRLTANILGYFRGSTLGPDPLFGPSEGFYRDRGYQNAGLNLNIDAGHGVTLYGNLRNLLNQRYTEILGYPAPLLNFVAGVKWSLPGSGK